MAGSSLMDETFRTYTETLGPKLTTLLAMPPVTVATLPRQMPLRGVYLFSDGSRHFYVGRTNKLCKRLQYHCRPSSSHFQATFAFRPAGQGALHRRRCDSPASG